MRFAIYLLQVTAASGMLMLVYRLCLAALPAHRFNRLFLLCSVLLSLVMPFIKIPVPADALPSIMGRFSLQEITIGARQKAEASIAVNWFAVAVAVYLAVVLLRLVYFLRSHLLLMRLLQRAPVHSSGLSDIRIVEGLGPGSYNGIIFFPDRQIDALMLSHEQAHIRHGHQLDVWLLQLIKCLHWANPFFYLLDAELRLVHEYEADEVAARSSVARYAELLLAQVFRVPQFSIAHSFFHHPIKNRILMLQKSSLRSRFTVRKAAAIALLSIYSAGLLTAQTVKRTGVSSRKGAAKSRLVLRRADRMPAFKGDVNEWLGSHLRYPDAARNKGLEGRVITEFVVNADGHISDARTVRSSKVPALDAEAIRVVSLMPAWKPGQAKGRNVNVYFNLPITFRLE